MAFGPHQVRDRQCQRRRAVLGLIDPCQPRGQLLPARLVTVVLAVLHLVGLAVVMIEHDDQQWYSALVPAVIYAVVSYYLIYDREAKAYFDA